MKRTFTVLSIFIYAFLYSNNSEYMEAEIRKEINKGVISWNNFYKRTPNITQFGLYFAKLDNRDLSGINLYKFRIHNCSFKTTKLMRANLEGATIAACVIQNTDFSYSNLHKASINWDLIDSKFLSILFKDGHLNARKIINCNFNKSDIEGINFDVFFVISTSFINCNIQNANFEKERHFSFCNFTNSNLKNSKFKYTPKDRIQGYGKVKFNNCNFTNANLTGIEHLDNAAFTFSDMTGAKIERKWFNYLKMQEVKNFDKIRWQ